MTFYFSGAGQSRDFAILAAEGAAGMVNALRFSDARSGEGGALRRCLARYPELPLVLDSGAFQGNTDLGGYVDLVREVGDRFNWYANLDVIGDQSASDNNFEELRRAGLRPLWIYQIAGGEPRTAIAYAVRQYGLERVGIGGLVPLLKSDVAAAFQLVRHIGADLAVLGVKAHFFGLGAQPVLRTFAHCPWFESADSQSWGIGFKASALWTSAGRVVTCADTGLALTPAECAANNVRVIHGWAAGAPIPLEAVQGSLFAQSEST